MIVDMRFRIAEQSEVLPGAMAFNINGTNKFQVFEVLGENGTWMQITGSGLRYINSMPTAKDSAYDDKT